MQLIPRYLLKNRIIISASDAGFPTEFMPVYTRQLKIYKGIDNTVQFRLLNDDQKPINIANFTPKFVAFDENGTQVISHDGSINQLDDSSATRGLFTVTIFDNETAGLNKQYLRYNIYLLDENNNKIITYVDSHFDNNATIYLDDYAFPGPTDAYSISVFTEQETGKWFSEAVTAEPAINGNEALHTLAIYSTGFAGDITVQATLDNQANANTNWANIASVSLNGTETEPTPLNYYGVFNFVRLHTINDPSEKINKVLIRN